MVLACTCHVTPLWSRGRAVPCLVCLQERQLTTCCCFSRGLVRAHLRIGMDQCQPGQTAEALLEVDNRSRVPLKAIQVPTRDATAIVADRLLQPWYCHGHFGNVRGNILYGIAGTGVVEAGGCHFGQASPPPHPAVTHQDRAARCAALHHATGRNGQVCLGFGAATCTPLVCAAARALPQLACASPWPAALGASLALRHPEPRPPACLGSCCLPPLGSLHAHAGACSCRFQPTCSPACEGR